MIDRTEIRFGGTGGQGVVLAAQILGEAVLREGKSVLQTQAYGAEARGSLTKSEVIISGGRIGFPAARKVDVLVSMSQEAADSLVGDLKEDGTLIVDSAAVERPPETSAKVLKYPMSTAARQSFGDRLYSNMVMLGVLVQLTHLARVDSIEEAIRTTTSARHSETNVKAFLEGLRLNPVD